MTDNDVWGCELIMITQMCLQEIYGIGWILFRGEDWE